MNKKTPPNITATLSRDEMKKTIAGSDDFRSVRCLANDYWLGEVQCSDGISNMDCCSVHHPETNQAVTLPQESPM
ncbi:MAG: hypothetical protein GVY07_03115 [Bacteroidetes bacterium]|jgi:hypothetical protein|nr:hypothetical protein [Bacteroidota bacterium]